MSRVEIEIPVTLRLVCDVHLGHPGPRLSADGSYAPPGDEPEAEIVSASIVPGPGPFGGAARPLPLECLTQQINVDAYELAIEQAEGEQ